MKYKVKIWVGNTTICEDTLDTFSYNIAAMEAEEMALENINIDVTEVCGDCDKELKLCTCPDDGEKECWYCGDLKSECTCDYK